MNIIYQSQCDLKFSLYGILIPIHDDRAQKVFDSLKKINPLLLEIEDTFIPKISKEDLFLCHDRDYVNSLYDSKESLEKAFLKAYELIDENGNYYRYDPTLSKVDFSHAFTIILKQVGLTYLNNLMALNTGSSYFLGGGMHHAMSFSGRGFCLVNDIVISLLKLKNENLISTAWVIDVDAHKGDGTSELTKSIDFIHTFSIHMKDSWPLDSKDPLDPCFIKSDMDIEIKSHEEHLYLSRLKNGLLEFEKKYPKPDLCIVVNGADPFEFDELSSTQDIQLTKEQMLERDLIVYHFLKEREIPQSYLMAGGYGKRSWEIYFQFLKFVGENSSQWPKIGSR